MERNFDGGSQMRWENPFGAPVRWKSVVNSTMCEARNGLEEGDPHGTVYVADHQKEGRGRGEGRRWIDQRGGSLLFTVLLERTHCPMVCSALPLLVGLAVSDALYAMLSVKSVIKWPNDLLVERKKLSGVLCEARGSHLLAGVGINCEQHFFPSALTKRAISLFQATGRIVDRRALLAAVLEALLRRLQSETDWRGALENRLFQHRKTVLVLQGAADCGQPLRGVTVGIGREGQLLVARESDKKIVSVFSGEVVLEE